MIRDCPMKDERSTQEVNFVFMNESPDIKQKNLIFESLGKGVLDCGCTRTVAGKRG